MSVGRASGRRAYKTKVKFALRLRAARPWLLKRAARLRWRGSRTRFKRGLVLQQAPSQARKQQNRGRFASWMVGVLAQRAWGVEFGSFL